MCEERVFLVLNLWVNDCVKVLLHLLEEALPSAFDRVLELQHLFNTPLVTHFHFLFRDDLMTSMRSEDCTMRADLYFIKSLELVDLSLSD